MRRLEQNRWICKIMILICVSTISGCGGISYQEIEPGEFIITAMAPYGVLGGDPSVAGISEKATKLCPSGYEKLGEQFWGMEGINLDWKIRCRNP